MSQVKLGLSYAECGPTEPKSFFKDIKIEANKSTNFWVPITRNSQKPETDATGDALAPLVSLMTGFARNQAGFGTREPHREDESLPLRVSEGSTATAIATQTHACIQTVSNWWRRFDEHGLDGLLDEPRPGQPRKLSDAQIEQVIVRTLERKPPAATHWSTRTMARASISTSHPPWPHGRTWWNAGSPCSPNARSGAASTAPPGNSKQPSTTSSNTTTAIPSPLFGINPQTRSSIL